jgi:hypothetical protein
MTWAIRNLAMPADDPWRRPVAVPIVEFAQSLERHSDEQAAYAAAAAELVADLERAGFNVDRLADLGRPGLGGRAAGSILLSWLPRVTDRALRIDIVNALGNRWAQPDALPALVLEHRRAVAEGPAAGQLRAAICTTLERVADETIFDDVVAIATDTARGIERGMAIVALGNMAGRREPAVEVLTELLDDDDVALFAVLGLAKLGARETMQHVAAVTAHRNPIVRATAARTVATWAARSGVV